MLATHEWQDQSLARVLDFARLAESKGFAALYVPNTMSYDALTLQALIAQQTQNIHIDTAVVPIQMRHPFAMAQQALTMSVAFPGRVSLSLGLSHKMFVEPFLGLSYEHPAQQIVLQDYIHAVEDAEARRDRLTGQIEELLGDWSMAPVVEALQAMRGVALVVAVTLVAEVGDLTRFDNPRQLMAYLGLAPSEHSSGQSVRRGGITKAGNGEARRVMVEAAWTYRMQARISQARLGRMEGLPKPVRDIAWKAEVRLCSRYRRLNAAGKPANVVTAAIAREMLGFAWAIARHVKPQAAI